MLLEQFWAGAVEYLLDLPSVLESLLHGRDQRQGHIHRFAVSLGAEGEEPGGVFVAAGTGGTVFADAGFFNQREGAFERGPEGGELVQKVQP